MESFNTIIELAQTAPLALVFFLLWKAGFFDNGKKTNGNTIYKNGYQLQIDELKEHAKTSNHEVGEIQKDIKEINKTTTKMGEDISYIKGKMDK